MANRNASFAQASKSASNVPVAGEAWTSNNWGHQQKASQLTIATLKH